VNVTTLLNTLRSLPKTLDGTYARILCGIDEAYLVDARKILTWLAYSVRPLRLEEIAEVVAIDLDSSHKFDPKRRLLDSRDLLFICSSLVTIVSSTVKDGQSSSQVSVIEELRLSHSSVKEYLISDRIQKGPACWFYMTESGANDCIANMSLAYLLQFDQPDRLNHEAETRYPLIEYAAKYWTQHAKVAETTRNSH